MGRDEAAAVISCAERLCEPAKVAADQLKFVPPEKIVSLGSSELGPGPWGVEASRTVVGEVRRITAECHQNILSGPLKSQVRQAVALLEDAGADPLRLIRVDRCHSTRYRSCPTDGNDVVHVWLCWQNRADPR